MNAVAAATDIGALAPTDGSGARGLTAASAILLVLALLAAGLLVWGVGCASECRGSAAGPGDE